MTNATTETVDGLVLRETTKALYVRMNQSHSDCWLPKSQLRNLSVSPANEFGERGFSAEVPMWLYAKLPMNWNDGTPVPYATAPW